MSRHPDFRAETPNTVADYRPGDRIRLRRNPNATGTVTRTTNDRVEVALSTGMFWYYPGDLLTEGQEAPEYDGRAEVALSQARRAWETMGWTYRVDYETYRRTGNPRRSTS